MNQRPRGRSKLFAPLSHGGLVAGLVFLGFSLTPSLLPRSPLLQGLVSGVSFTIGYGLGALLFWAGEVAPALAGRRGYSCPNRNRSKKPTTRRSYSLGCARIAPVWPAPGTPQSTFGSPAAS